VLGLGDDEVPAAATDGARLAQDHRDVVAGLLDSALGLRDDLLRDDDDVTRLQAPGTLDGIPEQPGEVVAGRHLRDAFQRQDADHSGSPVTLTPAFVL
jgi:hypothetical protein